jgi:hypothetical protein
MTKKFHYERLEKCRACQRVEECRPESVTAEGILLCCKSFYYVFCELDKKCRIPFDKVDKMQHYIDNPEDKPFLDPVLLTNGTLAMELALKYLTFMETNTFECTHKLDELFYALPEVHRIPLSKLLKEKAHQNDESLRINLEQSANLFQEWRYFFQRDALGYSHFLLDFIHIACEYAFEYADQIMGAHR